MYLPISLQVKNEYLEFQRRIIIILFENKILRGDIKDIRYSFFRKSETKVESKRACIIGAMCNFKRE